MDSQSNKFLDKIIIKKEEFEYYSLKKAEKFFDCNMLELSFCHRILLENLIRKSKPSSLNLKVCTSLAKGQFGDEIFFSPSRVLMQDYTGVPAIADLASMRDKMNEQKLDPQLINPIVPVSLIVDHSISVDSYSRNDSLKVNVEKEFFRNLSIVSLLNNPSPFRFPA